jgi:UDP-2,3-diacylglucosamine hydrolase
MKAIIVADVHLNVAADGKQTRDDFEAFLNAIDPVETRRVVLLGDLFDFWFEYRHVIFSGYFEILAAIHRLARAGVEFHFLCGNHDFWAGRFLRDHLGFHVHDQVTLDFDGKQVLFIHGDGIRHDDYSYRIYKRIARFAPVVGLFWLIHPDLAMGIAQLVSRGSRKLHTGKDPAKGREVEPLRQFARDTIQRGEADVVVCGHSHYAEMVDFATEGGSGLYINTGDFLWRRKYVVWDGETFEHKTWGEAPASSE